MVFVGSKLMIVVDFVLTTKGVRLGTLSFISVALGGDWNAA